MARRVHILHGFNVRDSGKATTGKLAPRLREAGFECIEHKWGWRGIFGTWLFNSKLVDRLMEAIEPGDDVIGHSDGCNIAMWAAERGAPIRRMVFINPAVDADQELPRQVECCLVFHDHGDKWVRLASWLPFNRWGKMGATGPLVHGFRYTTVQHGYGHSGLFKTYQRVRLTALQIKLFLSADLAHVYRN
jgi:pimeloyl-ACP methyl ester carboxylesterase